MSVVLPFRKKGGYLPRIHREGKSLPMPAKPAKKIRHETAYSKVLEKWIKSQPGILLMSEIAGIFGEKYNNVDNWLNYGKEPSLEALARISVKTREHDLCHGPPPGGYAFGEPGIPFKEWLQLKNIQLTTDDDVWGFLEAAALTLPPDSRGQIMAWLRDERERFLQTLNQETAEIPNIYRAVG